MTEEEAIEQAIRVNANCWMEDDTLYCKAWDGKTYRYGGYGVGWILEPDEGGGDDDARQERQGARP
jgi:hypothetical protein